MPELTFVRTGRPCFDELVPVVREFLAQDTLDVVIDGREIRGYRSPDARSIWIRDTSDMMRATRHFEPDLTSPIDHFAETQGANGRIFDYFTTFPEKLPSERENWTKYVRVPVEADVEYRFVKAIYLAWQASGDDGWVRGLVPAMERALEYGRTHPWRWDTAMGMVKRPYTIDTWDFAYCAGSHEWLQFQINDDTFWGIMHGDVSGTIEAYRLLGRIQEHLGQTASATTWAQRADDLQGRMDEVCWNGRFYTHFVKLNPCVIDGVDESEQLSLSNAMNINRGATSHEQAVAVLGEYRRRRAASGSFAEWWSIDPPFPDGIFGDDLLVGGAYCNGGIMPLVGGELARAAFEHGCEDYGVDILERYWELVSASGETYLWYFPDGTAASVETSTSPESRPTDGWGSSAMLYALVEGLAGVQDLGTRFSRLRLAPRWAAAGVDRAEVGVGYAASGAHVSYVYAHDGAQLSLDVCAPGARLELHLMLPAGAAVAGVTVDGAPVDSREVSIEQSRYLDLACTGTGNTRIRVQLRG